MEPDKVAKTGRLRQCRGGGRSGQRGAGDGRGGHRFREIGREESAAGVKPAALPEFAQTTIRLPLATSAASSVRPVTPSSVAICVKL